MIEDDFLKSWESRRLFFATHFDPIYGYLGDQNTCP